MPIEKLPSGKFRARVRTQDRSQSKTFATKAQANDWLRMIEGEQHARLIGRPAPGKTLGDLLRRYADEVSPTKRSARWETVRINFICRDPLVETPLTALRREHFAGWRDRRLTEVAGASVNREWTLLSAAINHAIREWSWLQVNPMATVQRPKGTPPRARRISEDEIERILWACGYERDGGAPATVQARVGVALLFAIETAMRAGEICGLTWGRVDMARRLAHLDKTKNGHARDVPLSREALRCQRLCKSAPGNRGVMV